MASSGVSASSGFRFVLRRPDEKKTRIRLRIIDEAGNTVLETRPVRITGKEARFGIRLGELSHGRADDIYSGNQARLVDQYGRLKGRIDPDSKDANRALASVVDLVEGWEEHWKILEAEGAWEVRQVPRHPRRTAHLHVTSWDAVTLPA